MSEVIQIQVGQTGNRLGTVFCQRLCTEHGLDSAGKVSEWSPERSHGLHKYFQETSKATFQPRSLLIDMEPATLDQVRGGPEGRLYSADQYLFDQVGTGNLFARGYYGEGAELAERVLEALRKQLEPCECLQGVQFTHSVGGGTGSGLGSLLFTRIHEEYYDHIDCAYTVLPSSTVSDIVTEPYNAVLALHHMADNLNMCMLFDNEALCGLLSRHLGLGRPTYREINHYIATAMSGITSPIRFSGLLNSNYRKLGVNIVPYPRKNFLSVSTAPLTPSASLTVPQAVAFAFDPANSMSFLPAQDYVIVALAALFRGDVSSAEADAALASHLSTRNQYMCSWWFPDLISSSISRFPQFSLTLLLNSPIISVLLERLLGQFNKLMRRKAFLHRYLAEGMEEAEFREAEGNVQDLYLEYGEGKKNCFCGSCDAQGRNTLEED